ncbi:2-polyprenyl-6-methoxyphenol hydroxylase-like FAD-dependent oxidoreductase [Sphaerotilus hippei]|uniref:2-polyprenyl-6-methoxyphenol hydroxylase-like FAD-dependent oxidoreductase n=1 Tax=Sphaerotilus hippei TaxID=744406 RepID=A0A318H7E1_9BURK|nr:FAD-dependent oxidoreductase [Sphaerotilus hippei]PXW97545.1 2-polyprenyl-6-methoxyphenol hydroxylase-like FAD-dependent oxidoreductase [Sphaerotilus hippei]
MTAIKNALVVGGGFSGMAAAITLQRAGIAVDLLEQDASWCPLGAGITVSGATLRALETLGVYPQIAAAGAPTSGLDLYTQSGQHLTTLRTPPVMGSSVADTGGILRPVMARILADATRAAGVNVTLGQTWTDLEQSDDQVHVQFSDGQRRSYDLVVGADGVHSKLRDRLMPEVPPLQYIGQGVWRAVARRPEGLERGAMWFGQHIKCGVNPVSATQMYVYITEDRPTKEHIDPATWPAVVKGLLAPFSHPLVQDLIPQMDLPEAAIDYRPLANLLVPAPWNRGRVVLIGDTVAATTPHLASGAGIGIESGIVLGEELGRHSDLQAALDAFHARRFERCRMVVKNSERLCKIEIDGGDKAEHAQIMRDSLLALTQPI